MVSSGVGLKIRNLRLGMTPPWSQYDLAKMLGVSRSLVASIESGRSKPSSDLWRRLEEAFPELSEVNESLESKAAYFGDLIRQWRREHTPAVTQEGLAQRLGVSRALIASYESGRLPVSDAMMTRITRVLSPAKPAREIDTGQKRTSQPDADFPGGVEYAEGWISLPARDVENGFEPITRNNAERNGYGKPSDFKSIYFVVPRFISEACPDVVVTDISGNEMAPLMPYGCRAVWSRSVKPAIGLVVVVEAGERRDCLPMYIDEDSDHKLEFRAIDDSVPPIGWAEGRAVAVLVAVLKQFNRGRLHVNFNADGLTYRS